MEPIAPVVMVVDDDALVLSATTRYLRRMGMRTVCSSSPFGVGALICKEAPDVIVLDCHMPGLTGTHLVRLLRTSPRSAHTPVILHSGDSEEVLGTLARSMGVLHASKARGPATLYDTIQRALAMRMRATASTAAAVAAGRR